MFYVIEFQTNGEQGSTIVTTAPTEQLANQKYHQVLAAAAVSEVEKHGAMIVTDTLFVVKSELAPRAVDKE